MGKTVEEGTFQHIDRKLSVPMETLNSSADLESFLCKDLSAVYNTNQPKQQLLPLCFFVAAATQKKKNKVVAGAGESEEEDEAPQQEKKASAEEEDVATTTATGGGGGARVKGRLPEWKTAKNRPPLQTLFAFADAFADNKESRVNKLLLSRSEFDRHFPDAAVAPSAAAAGDNNNKKKEDGNGVNNNEKKKTTKRKKRANKSDEIAQKLAQEAELRQLLSAELHALKAEETMLGQKLAEVVHDQDKLLEAVRETTATTTDDDDDSSSSSDDGQSSDDDEDDDDE